MPIGPEFESLRRRVQESERKRLEEFRQEQAEASRMPEGFFTDFEYESFLSVSHTIESAVFESMEDVGISNFRIRRSFSPKFKGGSVLDFLTGTGYPGYPKSVEYEVQFSEGEPQENWDDAKEYNMVSFTYFPENNKPPIVASATLPLSETQQKKYRRKGLKVQQAMAILANVDEGELVNRVHIEASSLNKVEFKNLVLILMCDPDRVPRTI